MNKQISNASDTESAARLTLAQKIAAEMTSLYRPRDPAFMRPGYARGIDYYSKDGLIRVLNNVLHGYHNYSGRYPDLLTPQLYSEKLNAFKFLAHIKVPESGNKLLTSSFLTPEARACLKVPDILWHSSQAALPPNNDIPPGDYYLKTNFGSGRCRRIQYPLAADTRAALEHMTAHWLSRSYGIGSGEWWYSVFERRVLLERAVTKRNPSAVMNFYVFRGRVKLVRIDEKFLDGTKRARASLFDERFQPFTVNRPGPDPIENLELSNDTKARAIVAAESLGNKFIAIRIDILIGDLGELYLNEITFTPMSGLPLHATELERIFGESWGRCEFILNA